jgi:hypothetical protein
MYALGWWSVSRGPRRSKPKVERLNWIDVCFGLVVCEPRTTEADNKEVFLKLYGFPFCT